MVAFDDPVKGVNEYIDSLIPKKATESKATTNPDLVGTIYQQDGKTVNITKQYLQEQFSSRSKTGQLPPGVKTLDDYINYLEKNLDGFTRNKGFATSTPGTSGEVLP